MLYKNYELHGVGEVVENPDGSVSWLRMPTEVLNGLDRDVARERMKGSTGVEIRFVIKSGDSATVTMSRTTPDRSYGLFHVYRGGVQGSDKDGETDKITDSEPHPYVISRSKNIEKLKVIADKSGSSFSPEVVRIIFDRGSVNIHSIEGDIMPPTPDMLPDKTLLVYGSSITHGSNSLNASHSWASLLAHNLDTDLINLGMAGCCALEPSVADYIARLGKEDKWHIAVLELGINVTSWDEEKIRTRATNLIKTVASANPEKPIVVISPFYHGADEFGGNEGAENWRRILPEIIGELAFPNVTFIQGTDVVDNIGYISADEVHPSIYGVYRIANALTERLTDILDKG